ncbi:PRELI domain-containing protein 2-like isoform X2 [Rhopilema esculentum]|uniref:PRELI domain-containing protein 2-like isoform X2 n=1 Tax=Rhopilema esculentum TaxID=499914 RepID=UPI0031D98A9A
MQREGDSTQIDGLGGSQTGKWQNMVLKAEFSHLFKFPFSKVVEAYFKKYEGGRDPNVQGITVDEHWQDKDNGIEYWRRSGKCNNVCPWFLRKFLADPSVFFVEEVILDNVKERLVLHTQNITYSNYIILEEKSEFRRSECNTNWTQFVQQGTIDAKGLGSVSSFVERFAKSFLVQGGSKGIMIMEDILASNVC